MLTQATSNGTAIAANNTAVTAVNTKLGTPAGASIDADIVANSPANIWSYAAGAGRTLSSFVFSVAASNLPSTYPLAAGEDSALVHLATMLQVQSGSNYQFTTPALALGPAGSGGGSLTTQQNTWLSDLHNLLDAGAGGLGAGSPVYRLTLAAYGLLPNVTVGGYAAGQDPATLIVANRHWQNVESYAAGNYTRNTTTGVYTFTRTDGSTFTATISVSGGQITGRVMSGN